MQSLERVSLDVLVYTKPTVGMWAFNEDCRPMLKAVGMLNPLVPRLQALRFDHETDKDNLEKVKTFSSKVETFQLSELFGVTWYATTTKRNINYLLTSYIPNREEVEQWDIGLAYD